MVSEWADLQKMQVVLQVPNENWCNEEQETAFRVGGRRKHEAVFLKTPLAVCLPEAVINRFNMGQSGIYQLVGKFPP